MDLAAVNALMLAELGEVASDLCVNGVRLSEALIPPEEISLADPLGDAATLVAWVVLRDRPGSGEGFLIAYAPSLERFCLAEEAPTGPPYVLGRHESLIAALKAM